MPALRIPRARASSAYASSRRAARSGPRNGDRWPPPPAFTDRARTACAITRRSAPPAVDRPPRLTGDFQDVEAVTRWRRYDAMIGVSEGNQDRAVRGRHAAAGDLELARPRRVPEAATEARIGHRVHVELPLPRPLRGDVVRQLVIKPG